MLDNITEIKHKDPFGALAVAAKEYEQTVFASEVLNSDHDGRMISNVVVLGMGGSALAAAILKAWLRDRLSVPFEVVRGYDIPAYVSSNTLVVASSYSGNTEETVSGLTQALEVDAVTSVITSGGKLMEIAEARNIAYVKLPIGFQPRMAVVYNLRALTSILVNFGLLESNLNDEIASTEQWLKEEIKNFLPENPTEHNYAKQIADMAVGKTPVFYGGALTGPLAYRFKISWNENAKNVAFCNELPEMNHNEFLGWSSHPVEKPFAVFDLISGLEHPQILRRFELTDRLLSGLRPKAHRIELHGDSLIKQLLWGGVLADFASIYTGILNGVDPTGVELIEKLKNELK